ncbi:hypothetical protein [Aureimonas sp. SK2]|uniref:hypothetical protein n=1 Tax=Aureimonas sp. SK2 TaxID=3015992 RepID=UPI0024445BE3|nr:hypothetical protein [Aureimonas sp. SK2]
MTSETTPKPPTTEPNIPPREPAPPAETVVETGTTSTMTGTAEEVRTSRDATGAPRSGEIVPTTVPLDVLGRPVLGAASRSAPFGVEVPGRAESRVLASGLEIPAHLRAEHDGEERLFTAATRTMRNRVLYEVDAPIPLTRAEFRLKLRSKAVREEAFEDGYEVQPG